MTSLPPERLATVRLAIVRLADTRLSLSQIEVRVGPDHYHMGVTPRDFRAKDLLRCSA